MGLLMKWSLHDDHVNCFSSSLTSTINWLLLCPSYVLHKQRKDELINRSVGINECLVASLGQMA